MFYSNIKLFRYYNVFCYIKTDTGEVCAWICITDIQKQTKTEDNMSLNKFMHPRNIYKKPPNFRELAIKYPEFRKFSSQDLSGKVIIDFKNQAALRALTCTLLQNDFGLNVEIPLNRLIPTLPLRLNYLLWIEDLLQVMNRWKNNDILIQGIDIGTGASCIYPLIAVKTNKWHMLASEVDSDSIQTAKRNIDANGFHDFIKVSQVNVDTILKGVLETDEKYDFCMCNPPFFSSEQDLNPANKSRSPSRPPPRNGFTGEMREVVVSGGEVAFIQKMIQESMELKTAVRIYSTMVGHKSSLSPLKTELKKAGVVSSALTEFCQGHTTRWGLAWTFVEGLDLGTASSMSSSVKKSQTPMSHLVPEEMFDSSAEYTIKMVTAKVVELLKQLEMEYNTVKESKYMTTLQISAKTNTWSNQRRKRRERLKQQKEAHANGSQDSIVPTGQDGEQLLAEPAQSKVNEIAMPELLQTEGKRNREEMDNNNPVKKIRLSSDVKCVLKASLFVRKLQYGIYIELLQTEGTGGKDSAHQVLQYLKNHLK